MPERVRRGRAGVPRVRAMTLTLRRLLVVPAALVALALTAGSAHAATYTHEDAAKDVQRTTNGSPLTAAPGNQSADLTTIQTSHRAQKVFLASQVREVQTDLFQMQWRIVTSKGVEFELYWAKLPGYVEFTLDREGKTITCVGLKKALNLMTDLTTFTIPRSCLGSPAWIRTGLWLMTQSQDESTYYMDDAQRTGKQNRQHVFLGPKVFRG